LYLLPSLLTAVAAPTLSKPLSSYPTSWDSTEIGILDSGNALSATGVDPVSGGEHRVNGKPPLPGKTFRITGKPEGPNAANDLSLERRPSSKGGHLDVEAEEFDTGSGNLNLAET
jgi:hypothetical protein